MPTPTARARCSTRGRATDELVVAGDAVVAADGIHSAARAQRYPAEGRPRWSGSLLWRGIAEVEPVLDGRSMIWAGHRDQKFVGYPIADLPDGRQAFNFVAELRRPESELGATEDWNRAGELADFLPAFEDWTFGWLDVPAIIRSAPGTFLFPMVDRDPVPAVDLRSIDAARRRRPSDVSHRVQRGVPGHPRRPRPRRLPARADDDVVSALEHYESTRLPPTAAIVEANRGLGPEVPMQLVHERAPDGFDDIDSVITRAEIDAVTESYRSTAGFALQALRDDPRSLIEQSPVVTDRG